MEKELSQAGDIEKVTSLTITGNQQKALSKEQEAFNRNIKKIEALRLEIIKLRTDLDEKIAYFLTHVHVKEKKLADLNKPLVKLLFDLVKNREFLTIKQRQNTKEMIAHMLEEIFLMENEDPPDDLLEIFKAVRKTTPHDVPGDDIREILQQTFNAMGVDIDLNGIHEGMTTEELREKVQQELKNQQQLRHEKRASKKKSKKQLEREETARLKQELKAKNISTIYKQLAKLLHPDLEQDPQLKLLKEEWMKKLTAAYENKDLHTLLGLELTWIQKEENNLDKLTTDKLNIYNEVLKEQVRALETELYSIQRHDRYRPLQRFCPIPAAVSYKQIDGEEKLVDIRIELASLHFKKLNGTQRESRATVKSMLQSFQEQKKLFGNDDGDLLFRSFFDDGDNHY